MIIIWPEVLYIIIPYMTNMEQWAKDWLEGQRNKGVKCLEIKRRGEKHYVYHSTTHWDREKRKAIKSSKYLGRLDYEQGFIEIGLTQLKS